jgi:UDP-N-acetylglucosamine--N-acetylmuramyl-(pentapeptide) pyrophosphoryl-undecaprenol N-acetylglucosamine transferase
VEVTFAGSPERVEARLVPEAGFAFDAFHVRGFPRRPGVALVRALALAVRAPFASRAILARRRPDVVLGAGGYVAGPMVVAAWTKRIPAALTEADAHLGLANRLSVPFARRVFLSFPIEGRSGRKYRVVGRPIPKRSVARARGDARRELGLGADARVLVVFGGSQGARALNELAVRAWGSEGPAVVHLCGERDFERLAPQVKRPDYKLLPFLGDFGLALGAADLAVARAGGSVWELAAAGVPAILVPYPHATAQHQHRNAAFFEGGAVVVDESELSTVPRLVGELFAAPERLAEMRAAMLRLAKRDAADEIAEELIALAAARR